MPRRDLIQIRQGTTAEWTAANPVLASGEPGLDTDTRVVKWGDGATAWDDLPESGGLTPEQLDALATDSELADAVAAASADAVLLTGAQTVAGVKTFSSSPVVPDATTSGQAVNKGQLDAASGASLSDASPLAAAQIAAAGTSEEASRADHVHPGDLGPRLIVPPIGMTAPADVAAWPAANRAIFMRFTVLTKRSYRYVLTRMDTPASTNIQAGVVSLGSPTTNYTRVMDSTVGAAPAAGDLRIDCGSTPLDVGEYALFLWASTNTIRVPYASDGRVPYLRATNYVNLTAAGVPASGTFTTAWGDSSLSNLVRGLALEAA